MRSFWRLSSARITVVYHGVDHERFTAVNAECAATASRRRWGLREPFFLYVARLEHPAKNHVRLIAAFERFKVETGSRWQLVLAGSDWHGAETVHAEIRRSSVGNDIRCLGFVPDAELPGLYQAADLFVYPSLYEGFGFPPLEAMACGCPVLCSTRGALQEVVGDAAWRLEPEDELGLKQQLQALAENLAYRQRLRAAGLERVRLFDWKRTAEETLKVYARASDAARMG